MAFKDGDFIEIDYTMWDGATDEVLGTTNEAQAKKANVFDEKMQYGPVLFIVGSPGTIKGMDRELRGMKEGEQKKFKLGPADAFGERNENLIMVMPLTEFRNRGITPYPGMRVDLDNTTATVKSVTSGRVTVDANHPFAGKEVVYEVKVIKQLSNEKDKLTSLGKSYGVKTTDVKSAAGTVELFFDDKIAKNADYFVGRAAFVASIFSHLKDTKKIEIREEYLKKEEKEAKSR